MELGENVEDCARREIREELGVEVGDLTLVGTFSDPSRLIRFTSGEVVQSITITFHVECAMSEFDLSHESRRVRWFREDEIDSSSIASTHSMIIPMLFEPSMWPVVR